MINIFDLTSLLGAPKKSVVSNVLIAYCNRNRSFKDWFQNKFLRYEFDKIDEDDLRVLDESVALCVVELLNQFVVEGDVASIKELLVLTAQVTDAAKIQAEFGLTVDELTNELTCCVEPKLSSLLKLLKVFGLTVKFSS